MEGNSDLVSFLSDVGSYVGENSAVGWAATVNLASVLSPMRTWPPLLRGDYGDVFGPSNFQLCFVIFEMPVEFLLVQKQAAQFRTAVLIGAAFDAWIVLSVAHHSDPVIHWCRCDFVLY